MSITVSVAAQTFDLTDLETVKCELRLSGDSDDRRIQRLIKTATDTIHTFLGYPCAKQTYIETLAGTGTVMLVLSRRPIVSLTEVQIAGMVVTDAVVQDAEAALLYRDYGWPLEANDFYGSVPSHPDLGGGARLTVQVTYEAGWALPDDPATRDLPHSIEEAAVLTVKDWFGSHDIYAAKAAGTSAGGDALARPVASKRIGDTAISYDTGAQSEYEARRVLSLPPAAVSLLNPWRVRLV